MRRRQNTAFVIPIHQIKTNSVYTTRGRRSPVSACVKLTQRYLYVKARQVDR